jgi:hypothetical protein
VHINYAAGKAAVKKFVQTWKLNTKQAHAFTAIANHSLGYGVNGDRQITMGILGQGGAGKSHLIDAVPSWFNENGREKELVVLATTGSAAVNIRGSTVHTATGIVVDDGDNTRVQPVTESDELAWIPKRYLIIDEVSMMDCGMLCQLDSRLRRLRNQLGSHQGIFPPFGRVLWIHDVCNIATVEHLHFRGGNKGI